jgi:hypothetical protein
LLTTSSFMSIVGVVQVASWARAVCIVAQKKEKTTTPVERAQNRNERFITSPRIIVSVSPLLFMVLAIDAPSRPY